jgi:membrane fusion protein (multidrug efflux system)
MTAARRPRLFMGGLLTAVITARSAGCREAAPVAAAPPPAVEVGPVAERDVPIHGEWVGTTVGYVTAQIRARVSGYLMRQAYREGTLVKAGDLLSDRDQNPAKPCGLL